MSIGGYFALELYYHCSIFDMQMYAAQIIGLGLGLEYYYLTGFRLLYKEFEGIPMMRAVDSRFLLLVKTP